MGRGADPKLERRRLVHPQRHDGRSRRPPDRGCARRDRRDGLDLNQHFQGVARGPRPAAGSPHDPGRTRQLSHRSLRRRGRGGLARRHKTATRAGQRRPRIDDRKRHGRGARQSRRLPHRRAEGHGAAHGQGARRRCRRHLGCLPQRRHRSDRARRRGGRLRRGLHLQILEWRSWCAGLHLRREAPPRSPGPAALRLVDACRPLRHGERLSAGVGHPAPVVRHAAHPVAAGIEGGARCARRRRSHADPRQEPGAHAAFHGARRADLSRLRRPNHHAA